MPNRAAAASRRIVTVTATAILVLAACTPAVPTASPGPTLPPPASATPAPPAAEVYSAIRTAVEQIRGLQPSSDVAPVTIDEAQLRTNLAKEFDKENTATDLAFSQDVLIALGLLPAGASIRALTLDFQGGQVAGYYSPDAKQLFVVSRSGGLGPAEEVTYAHEFTHQLQDQSFDLGKLGQDAANESDRALAQLGLIEGDAVSVQTSWTVANLTPQELGQLLAASLDPDAVAALQRAPAYLRETSLFPYQDGLAFVENLISTGGYDAVNAAFANPPQSTEQVLHPEKYAAHEAPIEVQLAKPAVAVGPGWTEVGQDTLGEFILRLWLTQNGVSSADARAAAAGWGGDRLALLRGPAGKELLELRTAWDSAADAAEFAKAAEAALTHLGTHHAVFAPEGSSSVMIWIGDDAPRALTTTGG